MVNGPNEALGQTSAIASEISAEFVARIIGEAMTKRLRTVELKADVAEHYNQSSQVELKNPTRVYDCNGFYSDHTGRVISYFPGSAERLRMELREKRPVRL